MLECTSENIQVFAEYWQKILGLQNWNIVCKVVRGHEFSEPHELQGQNRYNYSMRYALITLLNPFDHVDENFAYDMEQTLIHELLHAVMAPLDVFFPDDQAHLHLHLEQIINQLATAFCQVARDRSVSNAP